MYKVMANKPAYLELHWKKNQAVMKAQRLDRLTKDVIALSVSLVMGCDY